MSVEDSALFKYMRDSGVPHRIMSAYRPGAITNAGYPSRHSMGLAVDFAGPQPGHDTPELLAIFKALLRVSDQLHELIYAKAAFNIKNGQMVPPYAVKDHHDHVHVSVDKGVIVKWPQSVTPVKETSMADNPDVPNITGPLTFHPIVDVNGRCTGYYVFSPSTGEVHAHGEGAKYYGRSEDPTP